MKIFYCLDSKFKGMMVYLNLVSTIALITAFFMAVFKESKAAELEAGKSQDNFDLLEFITRK